MTTFVKYIVILLITANIYAEATIDTLDPQTKIYGDCGEFVINITELRNGKTGDEPKQVDSGISRLPVLDDDSYNFKPLRIDKDFDINKPNFDFNIYLEVDNKYQPAKAVFIIVDNANPPNILFDSIRYNPESIAFNKNSLDFGNIRLNTSSEDIIAGVNRAPFPIHIDTVYFKNAEYFSLNGNYNDNTLNTNGVINFNIRYEPEIDIIDTQTPDYDTLIIKTRCLEYKLPVSGSGVEPKIVVQDHNFNWHFKGDLICKYPIMFPDYDEGLLISNPGSDTLVISGFKHLYANSPILLSDPTSPEIPTLKIAPGDTEEVVKLCFAPTQQGEYFNRIYFESNAEGPDSVCDAYAISFIKGPYFTDTNIPDTRVGAEKKSYVEFHNNGTIPVDITGFYLEDESLGFEIIEEDIFPPIPSSGFLTVYPEDYNDPNAVKTVHIPIRFSPNKELAVRTKVRAIFDDDLRNDTSNVYNYIRGYGFIPKIKFNNYTFEPSVMINTTHPDTAFISINNASNSGSLFIKSISIVDYLSSKEDFIILDELPENISIPKKSSVSFRVLFHPKTKGDKQLVLNIVNDAGKFSSPLFHDTTLTIKGTGHKNLELPLSVDFINIPHCENDTKYFEIKNLSNEDTLKITKIEILNNEDNVFSIDKNSLNILPGRSDSVKVDFYPYNSTSLYNYSYVKLFNNNDAHNINITGKSYKIKVETTLDTIRNISPGIKTQEYAGSDISEDFDVRVYSENWAEADIREFYLEIHYPHNALRFSNIINEGDFKFNEIDFLDSIVDEKYSALKVTGVLSEIITKNGILFKPVFEILLGSETKIITEVKNNFFFDRNSCIEPVNFNGFMTLKGCNIEVRRVLTNYLNYEDLKIAPNPAKHESVEITYTLGLRSPTRVELLSSSGELIAILTEKTLNAGKYILTLDAGNYPSGTYTVRIKSGPFSDIEKFVITK